MAEKIGHQWALEKLDRGWRELGGAMYPDSNIAQPTYALRGNYGLSRSPEPVEQDKSPPTYEELHPPVEPRDDSSRDDRDHGLERD